MGHKYRGNDSMSALIADDFKLLQVLSRFGIPLGFGDLSVSEVCQQNGVDTDTFIAVCNYISSGIKPSFDEYTTLSPAAMMQYLRLSHSYFLDFMLPLIRREIVTAVDCSTQNEIGFLILRFFDEYVCEVQNHMEYENAHIFRYVEGLLSGHRDAVLHDEFSSKTAQQEFGHKSIDSKMSDLKSIIVRYVPATSNAQMLNHALTDLFQFEEDLRTHGQLEEMLFHPIVTLLESQVDDDIPDSSTDEGDTSDPLSQREREIIVGVVKGKTNKEIADGLCLSIHTVLTHRRNIARKLDIHSPAGLVIYAIVHGIVSVDDVKELIQ